MAENAEGRLAQVGTSAQQLPLSGASSRRAETVRLNSADIREVESRHFERWVAMATCVSAPRRFSRTGPAERREPQPYHSVFYATSASSGLDFDFCFSQRLSVSAVNIQPLIRTGRPPREEWYSAGAIVFHPARYRRRRVAAPAPICRRRTCLPARCRVPQSPARRCSPRTRSGSRRRPNNTHPVLPPPGSRPPRAVRRERPPARAASFPARGRAARGLAPCK